MMVTGSLVAPSLNEIIRHNVRALVRRFHLSRDWIIGLIGLRGSGKSLGGANLSVRDFMMDGDPGFSNMGVKLTVNVKDNIAHYYNLPEGGKVVYEMQYIDKQSFLMLDARYEGSILFFDEFNVEYGEARRSSSDVNLRTDRSVQQLRHLQCGMIYTSISEMYVDNRIRENTDLFIKCVDVALNPNNLKAGMQQGVLFEWYLYPMTPRVAGNGLTYDITHKPFGPIQIKLGDTWGIIDTYEKQGEGQYKYSEKLLKIPLLEERASLREKAQWGWLDDKLHELVAPYSHGDVLDINVNDLREFIGVLPENWAQVAKMIWKKLPNMDVKGAGTARNPRRYIIPVSKMLDIPTVNDNRIKLEKLSK